MPGPTPEAQPEVGYNELIAMQGRSTVVVVLVVVVVVVSVVVVVVVVVVCRWVVGGMVVANQS